MTETPFMKPDADVIVIGAGIMGSRITLELRRTGSTVLLLAAPRKERMEGSSTAVGIIRVGWLKSKKQKERTKRSLDLYREEGILLAEGAMVTEWSEKPAKADADYFAVNVPKALLVPDHFCIVKRVAPASHQVYLEDGRILTGRYGIVVATGADTGALVDEDTKLKLAGTPIVDHISYGSTLVGRTSTPEEAQAQAQPGILAIHRLQPFTCIASAEGDGEIRVGSSTTNTPEKSLGLLNRMLGKPKSPAFRRWMDVSMKPVIGIRAYAPGDLTQDFEPVWNPTGTICYVAGLAKLGYSLAPALAEEIVAVFNRKKHGAL